MTFVKINVVYLKGFPSLQSIHAGRHVRHAIAECVSLASSVPKGIFQCTVIRRKEMILSALKKV